MTFRERVEDSYLDTNLDDDKWWQDGGCIGSYMISNSISVNEKIAIGVSSSQ